MPCPAADEEARHEAEDPAGDGADHDQPDEAGARPSEHVVELDLPGVARDEQDQEDEDGDRDDEGCVEAAAMPVADTPAKARFFDRLPDLTLTFAHASGA